MDARKEFTERVNYAIEHQCHFDGKNHGGEEFVVMPPVSKEFSINCSKVDDINLDNAKITISEEQTIRDENGNVVFDAESIGCVVYRVTGTIRTGPAQDGV